jgi:hypothetical protein
MRLLFALVLMAAAAGLTVPALLQTATPAVAGCGDRGC